jgi:superfamily I DNA/RNA helicase
VIHGPAGSGKTMILAYYAECLAQASAPEAKPILILCYNEPLAARLASLMQARGLAGRVQVRYFHQWCEDQLVAFGQDLPSPGLLLGDRMDEMIMRVIFAVEHKHIPTGQYQAALIDEGHNFAPEWLVLLRQMVDPASDRLLLLYDDAQSIYDRSLTRQFSFASVGIQTQGCTTVLKNNYRNTRQILETASLIATDLLADDAQDDDGIPRVAPASSGRDGPATLVAPRLPNLRAEAVKVASLLSAAHEEGCAWGDMAVICRRFDDLDECAKALGRWKLPHQVRKGAGSFQPDEDSIKVMTMHACRGLEFAVVALVGVGQMPAEDEDAREEARLFYVAATRATQRLVITLSGDGKFGQLLSSGPQPG